MYILNRLIVCFLLLPLINIIDERDNWYAQITYVDEEIIRVNIQNASQDKIQFELDGKIVISEKNTIDIKRNTVGSDNVSIIASSPKEKVYLLLKYNGNYNSIIVDELEYQIGFYLVSLSYNCVVVDNYYNQSIIFMSYHQELTLHDISFFANDILPIFKIKSNISDYSIYAVLYIFIEDSIFINLPYNLSNYAFVFDTQLIDGYYSLKLKSNYSIDVSTNEMYLGNDNPVESIVFPMTFEKTSFSMLLCLDILEVRFMLYYNVNIEHTVKDDTPLIEIVNGEREIEYEKSISIF